MSQIYNIICGTVPRHSRRPLLRRADIRRQTVISEVVTRHPTDNRIQQGLRIKDLCRPLQQVDVVEDVHEGGQGGAQDGEEDQGLPTDAVGQGAGEYAGRIMIRLYDYYVY